MVEEGTAVVVEEVSTVAAVAADFMVAAEGFTAGEGSPAAAALDSAVDIRLAGIAAATAAGVDTMVAAADMDGAAEDTAGAAEVGAEGTVTAGADGAGDLVMAGLIGDMDGDIRMATPVTAEGITRPTLIRIRPMVTRRIT
jgi:hypothetical protein